MQQGENEHTLLARELLKRGSKVSSRADLPRQQELDEGDHALVPDAVVGEIHLADAAPVAFAEFCRSFGSSGLGHIGAHCCTRVFILQDAYLTIDIYYWYIVRYNVYLTITSPYYIYS